MPRSGCVRHWVWLRDLILSLAISAFIIVFIYQPVKVEGTSMMPSLADQERIFVNKFVYRLEPISRGDIVVFRYPRDPSKSYIKRVIGARRRPYPHRRRTSVCERRSARRRLRSARLRRHEILSGGRRATALLLRAG